MSNFKTFVIVLLILFGIAACGGTTMPITALSTKTESLKISPTISSTPTITLTITKTPSPTVTPDFSSFLLPTTPEAGAEYQLVEWSVEKAEDMVILMEKYPETFPLISTISIAGYYSQYYFTTFPLSEAMIRYPENNLLDKWSKDLGYYLLITNWYGDSIYTPQEYFAKILQSAIHENNMSVLELETWFNENSSNLKLSTIKLSPPNGFTNSTVVFIGPFHNTEETSGQSLGGGAFYWLLENNAGIQIIPVFIEYNIKGKSSINYKVEDLTGDGIEELLIATGYDTSSFGVSWDLEIFDLSSNSPEQIFISHSSNYSLNKSISWRGGSWSIIYNDANQAIGIESSNNHDVYCNYLTINNYYWNGFLFEFHDEEYISLPNTSACVEIGLLNYILRYSDPKETISLSENLVPYWPIIDTQDPNELDLLLGINHALIGNRGKALQYLNQVIDNPDSSFYSQAKQFLDQYMVKEDVYNACNSIEICQSNYAISYLVSSISPNDMISLITLLKDFDVNIVNFGEFDFEDDSSAETWFIHQNSNDGSLEFWILVNEDKNIIPFLITSVETITPKISFVSNTYINQFQIGEEASFYILRNPQTNQPYIYSERIFRIEKESLTSTYEINQLVEDIKDRLYSNDDRNKIIVELLAIENSSSSPCNPSIKNEYVSTSCSKLLYLIGLTYELLGNDEEAIKYYYDVWQYNCCLNYSLDPDKNPENDIIISNPYALMARFKLKTVP